MNTTKTLAIATLLIGSTLTGYFAYRIVGPEATTPTRIVDSTSLDNLELLDPDGNKHRLSQWHGKPQIINYWATWCGPCRKEIPVLINAQERYKDKDLVILGLSMDYPDDNSVVQEFMQEHGINYPVLMASDVGNQLAEFYGAENFVLPITIFISAQGEITQVHPGLINESQIDQYVAEIL